MTSTTSLTSARLAAALVAVALVAVASPAQANLDLLTGGPLDTLDQAMESGCAEAGVCASSLGSRTVYHKGYTLYLSPGAVTEGGSVVALSGSYLPGTSISRIQGGTDAVTVKSGDYVQLGYSETTGKAMDTYALSAIALGNSAWMIVGADVENMDEYVIFGWVTVGNSGHLGQSGDIDRGARGPVAGASLWGAVCTSLRCVTKA